MTADSPRGSSDLRALFVAAAQELLDEPDTSLDLRKVAERAGKSRTAPYLAFGKSEEGGGLPALQLAVAAEGFRELTDGMRRALRRATDPEDGLQALATAYLAFARDRPRLFRLMFGTEVRSALATPSSAPPAAREQEALRTARSRLEAIFRSIIERQAPGYLRGLETADTATAAGAIWAMVHGVAVLTIDQQWGMGELGAEGEDPEEIAARALRFLTTASVRSMGGLERSLQQALESKGLTFGGGVGRIWRGVAESRASYGDDLLSLQSSSRVAGPKSRSTISETASLGPSSRVPEEERSAESILHSAALQRARAAHSRLAGIRILWIDDDPEGVAHERAMLEGLGAEVVHARDSWAALSALEEGAFDLAISDIRRGEVADEGIRMLPALRALLGRAPVLFYVENLLEEPGTPAGAFGITNDPEELLHLVLDVVERKPGGAPTARGGKGRRG
jgi:CheY-like chemotaxis protein